MSEVSEDPLRLRLRVLVFWILFFSFIAYLLLTGFLVYQRAGTVQLTIIFDDFIGNVSAIIIVVFYATMGLYLTFYFYQRALKTNPEKAYIYALITVVIGVSAPYVYAVLLSFMGIMRNLFPLGYIGLLYTMGIIVGIRTIPNLITHITPK